MKCTLRLYTTLIFGLALAAAPTQAADTMKIGSDVPESRWQILAMREFKMDLEKKDNSERLVVAVSESSRQVFSVVEEMPEFLGGEASMKQYLIKNIKYPAVARENGIQGRVVVQFVVDRDGSVTEVQVIRGVDPVLDKEALRVVSAMPKWKPGKQHGKPVSVQQVIPIMFRLD